MAFRLGSVLLTSLLLVGGAAVMAYEPSPAAIVEEILLVPFNKYGGVTTSAFYSGLVEIIVAGYGDPVPGDIWAEDPFYAFMIKDPSRSARYAYGLRLSITGCSCMRECGAPLLSTFLVGETPPYSAEHVYHVRINIGDTPVRLTFGNGDCGVSDNTGCYVIMILGSHAP